MRKKDYKKGISDAMEAYEAFSEKQEAAARHVAKQVDKVAGKMDKLGDKIGEITDYITDQEKAELYRLNTPVDIADLGNQEKKMLLAILYQLAADESETTEEQQNYIRAVQKYLTIFNPQTEIDLEVVENIEDVAAQKAILQAVLEFFYLGTHPKSYTEDQLDFLECFQLNRKTRKEIMSHIETMAEAVGRDGIAEKYGFVPQEEVSKNNFCANELFADNGPFSSDDRCGQFMATDDYYCYATAHINFDFIITNKVTGTKISVPFGDGWKAKSWCSYGNHLYLAVSRPENGYRELLRKIVDVDTVKGTWCFLKTDFSPACKSRPYNLHDYGTTISCSDGILVYKAHEVCYWMNLSQPDHAYLLDVPFYIESAIAYEGRILMVGSSDTTEEINLYWHDPAKNSTYTAIDVPLCSNNSNHCLDWYDESGISNVEIEIVRKFGNHLILILSYCNDDNDTQMILAEYQIEGDTGHLKVIRRGEPDEEIRYYKRLLVEKEFEFGRRVCFLPSVVRYELSDGSVEYFDCITMEKIDVMDVDNSIYLSEDGVYLFKEVGDKRFRTKLNSDQRWETV